MEALHRAACSAVSGVVSERTSAEEMWSDASTTGLAAVRMPQTTTWAVQTPVHQTAIFAGELAAGLLGSEHLQPSNFYNWFVDNEAAARAMLRGHSASQLGDAILSRWISSGKAPGRVTMVPSECNIVDPLSRGLPDLRRRCEHHHPSRRCRWLTPRGEGGGLSMIRRAAAATHNIIGG